MKSLSLAIFDFLNQLKENNQRDWFEEHKNEYVQHQNTMKSFGNEIQIALNSKDEVDEIKVFRIYRDVRFSKDKTPYKTHLSIAFHRKKPFLRGGYYIHISPGDSFIACGFWDPSNEDLLRIRKEIEQDGKEMQSVLQQKTITSFWGEIKGDEVKTAPKGFSKEHPYISLIKKKQFIFTKSFTNKEVVESSFQQTIVDHFWAVSPFFDYMSELLTTDLNGESII